MDRRLKGHEGSVLCVRFNPQGSYCLTGGKDRCVRLWNPFKGLLVKTFKGAHGKEVRDVACTRDNARVASCGGDKQVPITDVSTGKVVRKLRGHDLAPVNCVRFQDPQASPSGAEQVLVSGGYDAAVKLWDLRSNNFDPIQTLQGAFKDSVMSLCTRQCEIVASSVDGKVCTYDVRKGSLVVDDLGPPVASVALSHDGLCLLAGLLSDQVALLDRSTGQCLSTYAGHKSRDFKTECALTHDDASVVSGSEDGRVVVWDLVEASVTHQFSAHPRAVVCSLALHPTGELLLTASTDGTVGVWEPDKLPTR